MPIKNVDFATFDYIYVMDSKNYQNIIALASSQDEKSKVKLLLNELDIDINEVPDPYWDDNGFEHVFQLIDSACTVIAEKLTTT